MKYLPLIALTVALSACAAQPPAGVQSVGQSQQPPGAVAACIAQKWADGSQQQVISQNILANGQAMDVYVPGQQPPGGAAAVVRPSFTGKGTSVGFRAGGGAGSDATSAISGCL
ncbi:hypothetical protein [Paraburkholderia susongensis]|uniref:Lipoprotein n=1 Tax=Paraburkholderia susongensis TaxID=1515439 RepID=A0A1X7J427_9BURK|nr:hypothetical protein [Paraburkholderia susongensis]SMG22469.1 hypothetical protein SAMN06265784_102190 [Paraburkholderia susongensis]